MRVPDMLAADEAIRTCQAMSRHRNISASVLLRSNSYVAVQVNDDSGSDAYSCGHGAAAAEFSVAADDEAFKGLVKEKREDCFHRLGGGDGIASALASHKERGIRGDHNDVQRRKEAFGGNTYLKRQPQRFFSHAWDALNDVLPIVLIVCAVVSIGFGIKAHGLKDGWYDGVTMLLAVFVVAFMSAANSHSEAKRFDQVTSESGNTAVTVVRAARRQVVSIFDIVVGDVVILKIGDSVPADGVFLEGHSLLVDESNMTGLSHGIAIDAEKNPFLTAGVKIMDGYGRMLVTAVGADTLWGELMSSINETIEPTPLQKRLEGLTSRIGKIGVAVAALVFTVLTARHFDQGEPPVGKGQVIFDAVFRSLVVAYAMPEGLPLAVTLSLEFSMKSMMTDKALVRHPSACETMASVTAICTDKTGTLTLNQMKVTEFWVGTDQPGAAMKIPGSVMNLLCQGAGLNTTGSVYKPDIVSPPEITGSSTEKALLSWAVAELGMDSEAMKRSCKVVRVEAFNSDKKRSGVMIRDNATGAVMAHWKGDAEMVLANCSTYVDIDGAARELDDEQRKNLEKVINGMPADSLRCIAFAYKQVNGTEQSKIDDEGLTLLGFVGLKDPCRPEVKAGIEACTKAGITVRMVTGDNILTARAIAKECGIISSDDPNGIVIEGHELRDMSPRMQLQTVDKIRVMARSLPSDKLALVQRLKQKGHVVAVTGDSTNDAASLKEANIGLAMSIQGTMVAKESSDIIILDDNFGTVVSAARWGRCVYNNIQKIIQFQLTVNVAALIINFMSAITTGKMPLTTGQLLWVNLVVDTMGALALATGTPTKALMENRRLIGRTAPLITNAMWRNLAAQAAFQVAVLLALQYRGRDLLGADEKANGTMIFNTFVLCQVFNEFNARKIEKKNVFDGFLKNRMFLVIVAVTLLLQVVTVEVLTWFAGTKRLALEQWGVCLAIAALSWPIGWAVKFVPVPDRTAHEILTRCRLS